MGADQVQGEEARPGDTTAACHQRSSAPGTAGVSSVLLSARLTLLLPAVPQVFFVIHLHAGPVINTLPPIVDPDPLLSCDLMDGRDAFLTLARDKHWEFSSLRRSKWSTLCMLVELHTQGQDRFVYTCNECKHHVETRWHCTVCEVSAGHLPAQSCRQS